MIHWKNAKILWLLLSALSIAAPSAWALPVVDCPALYAQHQPTFVHSESKVVWDLLHREIPQASLAALKPRWSKLEKLKQRYDWNELVRLEPTDPAYPKWQKALAEIRQKQSSASTTLSGTSKIETKTAIQSAPENFKQVTTQIDEWVRQGEEVTLEKALELNALFGQGQLFHGMKPGNLRKINLVSDTEGWVGYMPARDIEFATKDSFDQLKNYQGSGSPVPVAAALYQKLVSIHPFGDANGRTTRAAMEWFLQKHGFAPPIFVGENKPYLALFASRKQNYPAGYAEEKVTKGLEDTYAILEKHLGPIYGRKKP